MLESITVRGFKSIRELKHFELSPLTVLIGANGTGKSNLISLFDMLAAIVRKRLGVFVAENGGPDALMFGGRQCTPHIDVELVFGKNGYEFSLHPGPRDRLFFADEATSFFGEWSSPRRQLGMGHDEALLPDVTDEDTFAWYAHRAIRGCRVYHFNNTGLRSPMRQPHPVRDNIMLKPDASNLAPFLRRLHERFPDDYKQIVETVRLAAPFLESFVYRRDQGRRIELEWFETGDPDAVRGPIQFSDGTLRFICLTTLLLQPPELQPDVIIIDEPELGLHPYAVTILAALLQQASEEKQLIVSTQSVDLVSELEIEDIVIVNRKERASVFERPDPTTLRHWLEDYSLGELWTMNVLGGSPDW